jgi:outer membrane receptor protein involved in Fe transport
MGFRFGGKGTADVLLAPGLHALASAGQGFRSPQARSLGDGERTPFASVDSFEVGVRYRTGVFDAYAAGFYTRLDRDLVFDHITGRNEAVPATQRAGFSADVVARPAPYLLATTSVTFTHASFTAADARYDTGDLLPYVPQLVARTELAVTPTLAVLWRRPLTAHIGLGSTLLHERPLPYDEIGHDIFTLDARLSARLKEVEITADFTNLLDAKYYDGEFVYASRWDPGAAASLVPIRHVTVGPPFGAFFSLALHLS